jgi:hypothetical protein
MEPERDLPSMNDAGRMAANGVSLELRQSCEATNFFHDRVRGLQSAACSRYIFSLSENCDEGHNRL